MRRTFILLSANKKARLVGTTAWCIHYSPEWQWLCTNFWNCQVLNPPQIHYACSGWLSQETKKIPTTLFLGFMSLFHTSSYSSSRFFHHGEVWHLISSFMLSTAISLKYRVKICLGGAPHWINGLKSHWVQILWSHISYAVHSIFLLRLFLVIFY